MGSMMTSCKPAPGDIWLAYVEYKDHPGVGKVRPVIIVDVLDSTFTALAAKVTSKDLSMTGTGIVVPIIDWQHCGLRKPSYVRLDQKLILERDMLKRDEPIGRVSDVLLQLIASALK
ncbi:MAG: type II toxin-antitoxin system PemK/MazF family toxin [Coriobacteriales bacterium]